MMQSAPRGKQIVSTFAGFEHLPLKAVSRSVAPSQVSYSLNSDLGTEYLIAEMLYIE